MNIIVIGGFLGAGKTTVLMQLARYLTDRHSGECRYPVVILENEISEAGVDNQLLRRSSFTVENIFSGCICCTSTAQLAYSVREIEENYAPKYLVIEATGVAFPGKIREELVREGYSCSILSIADAKRWSRMRLALEQFIQSQMQEADVILLNKVDTAEPDAVQKAEADLRTYNTDALLFPVCALDDPGPEFWRQITERLTAGKEGNGYGLPA